MKQTFTRKALYGAVVASLGMALAPAGAQAAAYYYSSYELTNINLYAEYTKVDTFTDNNNDGVFNEGDDVLTTTTVWARPASNENDPRAATFNSDTSAANTAGGSDANNDGGAFNAHVPPAGFFPVDAAQSFTTTDGTVAPAENTFTQTQTASGNYSRADALLDNEGITVNDFNVLESAGEASSLVAEGRSTSSTLFSSQAESSFTGYLDLTDLTLDDPGDLLGIGTGYDGTNLGWTGRIMLSFDFATMMVLTTDPGDPQAQAAYNIAFALYEDTGSGKPLSENRLATGNFTGAQCELDGDADFNDNCGSSLVRSLSRSNGGDFSFASVAGASFQQIWDFSDADIDLMYAELTFQHNVAGRAESAVPEPGMLALLGAGLLGLGWNRRQRKVRKD